MDPKLTIRPSEDLRRAALDLLRQRGLTAQDYVLACLAALVADPDRQIANVADHWPEPKPRGRPRKNSDPGEPIDLAEHGFPQPRQEKPLPRRAEQADQRREHQPRG